MKKILFGITSLTIGGAERVLVDLVNKLSSKYDITIITLYGKGELESQLSNNVRLVNIYEKAYRELTKIEKIIVSFRVLFNNKNIYDKFIKNDYDAEIAFLEGPMTRIFSNENNEVNKIAWVHNDIGKVFGKGLKAKIKRMLDKKCYSHYNNIVFVSRDNKEQFENIYNLDNNKVVISNYISIKRVLEKCEEDFENIFEYGKINFLTVARLTEQKGIDRLVRMHSKLIKQGYDHRFWVIGDGPQCENLKQLIEQYDVEESFKLLGEKVNPYPYIKNCDIFALLSYYEGFPMTILEARILNKPILITNNASKEAVEGYHKVCVTENTEYGVYEGIRNSITNFGNAKYLQKEEYTDNDNIIKEIEKLVEGK